MPNSTDDVVISSNTITLNANSTANSVTINNNGVLRHTSNTSYSLTISGALTVNATVSSTGSGTFTLNAASVANNGPGTLAADVVNVSGNLVSYSTLTVGSLNTSGNVTNTGNFTVTNLIFQGAAPQSATFDSSGTSTVTNLTVNSGSSVSSSAYSRLYLKGALLSDGDFNLPNTTLIANGSAAQSIGGGYAVTLGDLTINNASGLTLTQDLTITDALTLTNGIITASATTLILSKLCDATAVSGGTTTSHVAGKVRLSFPSYQASCVFPVGSDGRYAPITFSYPWHSPPLGGSVTGSTTSGDHPDTDGGTSGISAAMSVNRYWTLTPESGATFYTYDATFRFCNAAACGGSDLDAAATPANFIVAEKSGTTWTTLTSTVPSTTTRKVAALTAFGDFAIGEAGGAILAEWRMDELNWNGTANEVKDSSGKNFHGTAKVANGTTPVSSTSSVTPLAYTSGSKSTCGYGLFDGTLDSILRSYTYVELPSIPVLPTSFTFAAWVRSTNPSASGQRVLVRDDNQNGWGLSLGDPGQAKLRFFIRNNSNSGAVTGQGSNPNCGVFCLDTDAVVTSNNWYFVAASIDTAAKRVTLYVFNSSGVLQATTSAAFATAWQDGTGLAAIGGETADSSEGTQSAFHFLGNIDEVKIYSGVLLETALQNLLKTTVRTCPVTGPDHYELSLPANSINCLSTPVTVTACANNSSPCTSPSLAVSGSTASLVTNGGTLAATSVTFNASGVASTTLNFPAAADLTTVAISLSGEQLAATNVRKCCPDGVNCAVANSCSTTFTTTGFVFSSSAGGAVATIPAQVAGVASGSYFLRAVKSSTTTQACEAALTGQNAVNLGYTCNNPTTCDSSNRLDITPYNGPTAQPTQTVAPASSAVSLYFDANGNAPLLFNYRDVGQVTINASKAASGPLLSALAGSSNAFVTKPWGFALSGIKQTASPFLLNPSAASAAGSKFVRAGESFSTTVTAIASGGATTPSYGRETTAEGVLFTSGLVLPSGGNNPALSNGTVAGGSFSNGVATATNLSWGEVGIITLTPSVADGSYLGAGDVTGTSSGNVGRFFPDHFAVTPGITVPACSSVFTYFGQDGFTTPFTLTAQNSANGTTKNYTGSFAKLNPTNYPSYGFSAATLPAGSVLATSATAPTGSWTNGVASDISAKHQISRPSALTGQTAITVSAAPTDGEVPVGASAAVGAATNFRYGRLWLGNAYGSERASLSLPYETQYWNGFAFVRNTLDSCTALNAANVGLGNYQGSVSSSNLPLTAITMGAFASGSGSVALAAPSVAGSVDVVIRLSPTLGMCPSWVPTGTPTTADYLRGSWCGVTPTFDPFARATFGISKSSRQIYLRENF